MPEIMEHVAHLSQQIGPRPAGTEEEQQAALYISDHLQKEAGLPTSIEDFTGSAGSEAPRTVCCFASALFAVISLFLPVLAIPAIIVSLLAAVLFAGEAFGKPVLSKFFARGVSQNVVAKYEPGYSLDGTPTRRRKVVLVARYDSGKVRAELNGPLVGALPVLHKAELAAMVLIPVLLIIKNVFFAHADGAPVLVFTTLIIVAVVVAMLPVFAALVHKLAAYNDGANCNASGVAVLLEVATRIGCASADESGLLEGAEDPRIHGEEAARAAGLVPEGAQLVYEVGAMAPPDMDMAEQSPEARLAAAKAAVAALSGKPVNPTPYDISSQLVQVKEAPLPTPNSDEVSALRAETRNAFATIPAETMDEALANAATTTARADAGEDFGTVSSWFGSEFEESAPSGGAADEGRAAGHGVSAPSGGGAPDVVVAGSGGQVAGAAVSSSVAHADAGVPDWFRKAQEKAKKTKDDGAPVQRSRYAEALELASRENSPEAPSVGGAVAGEEILLQSAVPVALGGEGVGSAVQQGPGADAQRQEPVFPVQAAGGATTREGGAPDDASGGALGGALGGASGDAPQLDGSTCAMPPLDVSDLREQGVPKKETFTIPSFLRERAARDRREVEGRTTNRVEVSADTSPVFAAASGGFVQDDASASASGAGEQGFEASGASGAPDGGGRPSSRRDITLPSIGASSLPPLAEMQKQRAPLAEAATSGKSTAKSLLNMLPSIDLGGSGESLPAGNGAGAVASPHRRDALRSSLPSLSGAIAASASTADREASSSTDTARQISPRQGSSSGASSSRTGIKGTFLPGATGTFAPVGEELLQNVDPNDIYVDDADDSGYEGNVTETGAFAGPGYVDMPKSRTHRFFGKLRFGKRREKEEDTPQEWLQVDDSFDARSVGAARGGWESFRQEGEEVLPDETQAFDAYDEYSDEADGGYEEERFVSSYDERGNDLFGASAAGDEGLGNAGDTLSNMPYLEPEDDLFGLGDDSESSSRRRKRKWHGGAFSLRMMKGARRGSRDNLEEEPLENDDSSSYETEFQDDSHLAPPDEPLEYAADEIERIYRFKRSDINTEVWFVALGSELARNGGMSAFLTEHAQDLRGAIIIELEGMGAGELSLVEREGAYKAVASSSRMKRYVKKASQALGMSVPSAQICWKDSAASYAVKHGFQAMHLAGMDGAKPALFAQADDVMENIDVEKMLGNSDFIMELLKNI